MIDLALIIQIESSANPDIEDSPTGARGLCQILPSLLVDFKRKTGKTYTKDQLHDPMVSLELCEWYITREIPYLLAYYGYPETKDAILFCYSDGIGTFRKWNKGLVPLPKQTKDYWYKYDISIPKHDLTKARQLLMQYRKLQGGK